jgi:hypothetical protein
VALLKLHEKDIETKDIIRIIILSIIFFLLTEMIFSMLFEYIVGINLFQCSNIEKFLIMLPLRFVQINIIRFLQYKERKIQV